jgi:Zn-dependent peptidase ImmA (M78 family)
MPREIVEVPISPVVLKWARETSGATIEDAAGRIGMPPSSFSRLEQESSPIRLSQLRTLAEYFKRPLSVFLLDKPPVEPQPPPDFRLLPGHRHSFERETRLAIRKVARLRDVARELMGSLSQQNSSKIGTAKLSDSPFETAKRERKILHAAIKTQVALRDDRHAYRTWRALIEAKNILVFQIHASEGDARGFSLSDAVPFAIAVSAADAVRARLFTLFHEYAHLLLRRSGVCLPGKEPRSKSAEASVERWCDQFAGAFLVPADALRSAVGEGFFRKPEDEIDEALNKASRTFRVSEQVVLFRMRDLDWIPNPLFNREMGHRQRRSAARKPSGGAVSPSAKILADNGHLFTSLVLEARGRNIIDYADVSDYLSLNLKYLGEVRSSMAVPAA